LEEEMKKGKWLVSAVLAMAVVIIITGCKKENTANVYKVGYANNNDADIFDKLKRDTFEETTKTDSSIRVVFTNANIDTQMQLDHIDNFIAQKMNAIIICPVDSAGILPAIEKANAANIPVICIGVTADAGDYIYVGTQYIDAGERQGRYMAEHLPQNATVVYLSGTPGYVHSRDRRAGFLNVLSASRPDVTVVAEQTGNYERAKGMQIMEDWIQAFPKIDGVVAANDQMALGALEALKAANRLNGVLIAGVDAIPEVCQAIKDGEVAISILQSAPEIAQSCYDTVKKLQNGESVGKEIIIPHANVTLENVDDYL
jgi:inositol transport system substrate-binding protein